MRKGPAVWGVGCDPSRHQTQPPSLAVCLQGWRSFTTGRFECDAINGNHLWPLQPDAKRAWLSAIAQALEALRL